MFRDRRDAGIRLAERLEKYRGKRAVVLALPRGGVAVGFEVARALHLPLDIIAVRKIGHPHDPEFAIGAIDERGETLMSTAATFVDTAWFRKESKREEKEAKRRAALYRDGRAPISLKGRTAIIVDDGVATGLTMRLAIRAAWKQDPASVVVAVPVASDDAVQAFSNEVDEIIVLEPPKTFLGAVGAHYTHFGQMSDGEVVHLMRAAS